MAHRQQFKFPTPSTNHDITTPQTQYTLFNTSQGNSPTSGASSATNTPLQSSPTSPNTMHPSSSSRQLRPQKVPMYVPAVLRPNQHQPRRTKGSAREFTPPDSTSGSLESANGFESDGLKRSSTAESAGSSKWALSRVGSMREGAGVGPSREHWKPDSASTLCDAPSCTKPFSTFNRRHHCRRCGNIFCHDHSSYLVPLDVNASFSPDGCRSRACDHCFNEYIGWEQKRRSARERANTTDGNTEDVAKDMTPAEGMIDGQRRRLGRMESIAASVPRDWNWSTF